MNLDMIKPPDAPIINAINIGITKSIAKQVSFVPSEIESGLLQFIFAEFLAIVTFGIIKLIIGMKTMKIKTAEMMAIPILDCPFLFT